MRQVSLPETGEGRREEFSDLKTPVSLCRCMTFFSIFDQQLQRGEPCSSRLLVANGFEIDRVCTASHFVCVGDFLNINLLGGLQRRSYKQRKRETNNKHSRPNLGWGGVAEESLSPTQKTKQNKTKQNDFQSVSHRTRTSVDEGGRKSNNWLDQWLSGKLGIVGRV